LSSSSSRSAAEARPVIAEPEIHGSQSLVGVTGFLLLLSEGLINALEAAHGPEQANQVRGPANQVRGPANQVRGPANQVRGPATQVRGPADQVRGQADR